MTPDNKSGQKIVLAADHAGFNLKESLKTFLEQEKYEILDVGAHQLTPDDDYPEYMAAAAMQVARDIEGLTKAIIFGGSGQGEAIAANRFQGVRAVVWYGNGTLRRDESNADQDSDGSGSDIIRLSRQHNDANILSIGARFVSGDEARDAVKLWLATPFIGQEKHLRRIEEIDSIK